jgi:3-hydroxyisobutyrate dehydrogenase-like beta-hydroxyacid dehydrogenase
MSIIGLLHPGEMGAELGAQLRGVGHEVLWISDGRSPETVGRARAAGLTDAGNLADLRSGAQVILSVCPPHAAREVAAQLAGFDGLYVDANAVAPDTVRALASSQPGLVDGGIVGPPPRQANRTRLFLSGPAAAQAAELFAGTTVATRVVSAEIGAASAVKMAYAAWTKGTAALLLAIRALARAEGVEPALLEEWERSQPGLIARSDSAAASATAKGWRWSGEMEEIAAAFSEAGLPAGFHLAAAEIYARSPRGSAEGEDPLARVLATLVARRPGGDAR